MKKWLPVLIAFVVLLGVVICLVGNRNTPVNDPTDAPSGPSMSNTDDPAKTPTEAPTEAPTEGPKLPMDVPRFTWIKYSSYNQGRLGRTQEDTFEVVDGLLKRTITGPLAVEQEIYYDLNTYRQVSSVTYFSYNQTIHYTYDEYGNTLTMEEYTDKGLARTTTYENTYGEYGLVSSIGTRDGKVEHYDTYEYDEKGRLLTSISHYTDNRPGEYARTEYLYNDAGYLREEISYIHGNERSRTYYSYDEQGRLIRSGYPANQRRITYNSDGTIQNVSYYDNNTLVKSGTFEYDTATQAVNVVVRDKANEIIARYSANAEIVNLPYEQAMAALEFYEEMFPDF